MDEHVSDDELYDAKMIGSFFDRLSVGTQETYSLHQKKNLVFITADFSLPLIESSLIICQKIYTHARRPLRF